MQWFIFPVDGTCKKHQHHRGKNSHYENIGHSSSNIWYLLTYILLFAWNTLSYSLIMLMTKMIRNTGKTTIMMTDLMAGAMDLSTYHFKSQIATTL